MNVHGFHTDKPITIRSTALVKPTRQRGEQSPFRSPCLNDSYSMPVSTENSTELGIFAAERYFGGGDDNNNNVAATSGSVGERYGIYAQESYLSSMDGYGYGRVCRNGASPFHVAPSSSSEASWNSRSGLLNNLSGSASFTFRNSSPGGKSKGSSSFRSSSSCSACRWLFARGCPCSGKRSLQVEECFQGPKPPSQSNSYSGEEGSPTIQKNHGSLGVAASDDKPILTEMRNLELDSTASRKTHLCSPETQYPSRIAHRIVTTGVPFADSGGFTFPILIKPSPEDEPPRDSLEVFQPKDDTTNTTKSAECNRWNTPADNNRRSIAVLGSPRALADDDKLSDSSSDLFEIESFSTQMTSAPACRRRDSLDEILAMDPRRLIENAAGILQLRRGLEEPARPSSVPSECYPPSEASVQWSVTTAPAEGFDRASVANFSSAASEYEEAVFAPVPDKNRGGIGGGGDCGKKKGGLLSCRSEKAVSVNGPVPSRNEEEQRRVAENRAVSTAVRAGNGGGVVRSSVRPPLARSHSARLNGRVQTRDDTRGGRCSTR